MPHKLELLTHLTAVEAFVIKVPVVFIMAFWARSAHSLGCLSAGLFDISPSRALVTHQLASAPAVVIRMLGRDGLLNSPFHRDV